MTSRKPKKPSVSVAPLTPAHWPAIERLFGEKGGAAGCWCMFWRLEDGERFDDVKGEQAKKRFRLLVKHGAAKGFLAFEGEEPVGWLAAGPRTSFPKLDRAPSLACDDAERVWSLPCFFIKPSHRGKGVATALLSTAKEALREEGAALLEGYPVKPANPGHAIPAAFAWTGTLPLFEKAGFRVVARKPKGKQRVRLALRRR
jgi:GNAT superfamily N-acetyltransferase